MRRVLLLLAVACLAFAPAPFPRPDRRTASISMAGTWDVDRGGMPVRLALRPDGSARFEYTKTSGAWDGSWKYDVAARRVTLTLIFGGSTGDYILAFSTVSRDSAEGRIQDTPTSFRPLKLMRSSGR